MRGSSVIAMGKALGRGEADLVGDNWNRNSNLLPILSVLGHAIIEDDVDDGSKVDRVLGGHIDKIATPFDDIGAEIAIFRAENIEGALWMLVVGQGNGIAAPLNGDGDAVIRDDGVEVVNLEQGEMTIGIGSVGGLDTVARAGNGDHRRAKTKGRAQNSAHVVLIFWI